MNTPKCENCGSHNTAHFRKFKWYCQDCGNLTPGRDFLKGDPHIQEIPDVTRMTFQEAVKQGLAAEWNATMRR